ncbi:MAG: DMT family transporter [Proteobacteria bacterium]|nr:DMT family transporter [Pseudomonadota bacterium]
MVLARLHETDVARGILYIVIAMFLFTIQDAIAKLLVEAGISIWQVIFCRAAFAFIPLLPLIHARKAWAGLRTRRPRDHLARCLVAMAALLCFFHGLRAIPLADAYALSFSAPLFMTALSVPLLGERVGWHRWSAVGVGFVGVIIMVQPGSGLFQPAALVVLLAALLYALAVILVRGLSATEPALTIVFYFSLGGALMSAPALPLVGVWPADATAAALMVAIGVVGGLAQLFLTLAYARAPVAVIAPFDYTALVWAVLAGWLLFDDVPAPAVMAGTALVIAGGVYIVRREARLGRPRAAPAKPAV